MPKLVYQQTAAFPFYQLQESYNKHRQSNIERSVSTLEGQSDRQNKDITGLNNVIQRLNNEFD